MRRCMNTCAPLEKDMYSVALLNWALWNIDEIVVCSTIKRRESDPHPAMFEHYAPLSLTRTSSRLAGLKQLRQILHFSNKIRTVVT